MVKQRTITMAEIKRLEEKGITTFSKKDNSERGCKTIYASQVKVGDKVVIDNYFTLVIE